MSLSGGPLFFSAGRSGAYFRVLVCIGHVEEVASAGQGAQRIPGIDVSARVARVAVGTAERDGNVAVGGHGEDEQQLLHIGALVLPVTKGEHLLPTSTGLSASATPVP